MRTGLVVLVLLAVSCAAAASGDADAPTVRVVEVVADPQTDWNGDGKITPSDEFVELMNAGDAAVDLTGWVLLLEDTTPDEAALLGTIAAGGRLVAWNPPGALNNDAVVRLVDASGVERHRVAYGAYDQTGTVPDANAAGRLDEALVFNGTAWRRGHATPGVDGDQVQRSIVHALDERAGVWYAPPNATRSVTVGLVHADHVIDHPVLDGAPPVSVEGAPGHAVDAVFSVSAGVNGSREVVLAFTQDGAATTWVVGRLVVDGDPPSTPVPAAPVWASGDTFVVGWPTSVDAGVGGVVYDAEVEREANGTRTVDAVAVGAPEVLVGGLVDGALVDVRVRAKDAYGNAGSWSPTVRTRVDQAAPGRPADLLVDGAEKTRLSWTAADDVGAGVVGYDVERLWDGTVAVFTVGEATAWTDPDSPHGGNLSYRVRAVDGAGNAGAWNETVADHAALFPSVVGIRVAKPVWTGGVQEVRVDFDRRMDASRAPTIESAVAWSEARWFANASTYYLKAAAPDAAVEGANVVRVAGAWADDGRALRTAAEGAFRVDTMAPASRFDEATGLFEVDDAQDPAPRLFVKRWPAGEDAPAAYVQWDVGRNVTADVEPGGWRLKFFAVDDAGNQEAVHEATFVAGAPSGTEPPDAVDEEAAAAGQPTPSPRGPAPASPLVPGVPPPPSSAADAGGLADVESQRRELAAPQAEDRAWAWWGLALGGVTASGGVFAWRRDLVGAVARRWRAWRRPASLAVRLRRIRRKG